MAFPQDKKEYIPLLEQIRKDLRAKRDTAPKVSLAEVEWALKILKKS
ncbi:MAG TPA: hypothetical protein PKV43_11885 [Armatimonadota bacterium]|nr:hypothetical protein [Armatimonadota bacterium]